MSARLREIVPRNLWRGRYIHAREVGAAACPESVSAVFAAWHDRAAGPPTP